MIDGTADRPDWLSISDDRIELLGARESGVGHPGRTTGEISQPGGPEAAVGAIGKAGENLVPLSVVMAGYSHSGGGVGSVLGGENLKAIIVRGTGRAHVAGSMKD